MALLLDKLDMTPESQVLRFLFASTSSLALLLSWLSAQLATKTIWELYLELAKVTDADHKAAATSGLRK